jgi:hypothetical protein
MISPCAHTKIVVTSGRDYESDRLAAREAGADDYLTKPIKPYDLLALIARLTDETTIITQPSAARPVPGPQPTWVKFWGVRGSIPSPGPATVRYGGNTTCVELRTAGRNHHSRWRDRFAAAGARVAGRVPRSTAAIEPVALTHALGSHPRVAILHADL